VGADLAYRVELAVGDGLVLVRQTLVVVVLVEPGDVAIQGNAHLQYHGAHFDFLRSWVAPDAALFMTRLGPPRRVDRH
jgi:hypothetical protein